MRIFVIATCFAATLTGCTKAPSPHQLDDNAHTLTARQLAALYHENAAEADLRYKNKSVLLTGQIRAIKEDLTITLLTPSFHDPIRCRLDPEFHEQIVGLRKEQHVTLRGKCLGRLASSAGYLSITLDHCYLTQP